MTGYDEVLRMIEQRKDEDIARLTRELAAARARIRDLEEERDQTVGILSKGTVTALMEALAYLSPRGEGAER